MWSLLTPYAAWKWPHSLPGCKYLPRTISGLVFVQNPNFLITPSNIHVFFLQFPPNATKPDMVLGTHIQPGSDHTHFLSANVCQGPYSVWYLLKTPKFLTFLFSFYSFRQMPPNRIWSLVPTCSPEVTTLTFVCQPRWPWQHLEIFLWRTDIATAG